MTNANFNNTDEYITMFPKDVQAKLQELREIIKAAAPQATEVISYKMPAFKIHSVIAYFAAYKNHVGFYPFPSGVKLFESLAESYNTSGKGTIQFPYDQPFPVDLIKKVIEYRVQEDRDKHLNKKSKKY